MMMVVRVCVCGAARLGARGMHFGDLLGQVLRGEFVDSVNGMAVSVGREAPRWGVRKILDALEEGSRKVLEAATPCAPLLLHGRACGPVPFF